MKVSDLKSAPFWIKRLLGNASIYDLQSLTLPPGSSKLVSCLCDGVDHGLLYECDTFNNLEPSTRVNVVESLGVCRSCLLNHPGDCRYLNRHECQDQNYGDKHNWMLCPHNQCTPVEAGTTGLWVAEPPG